LKKCRQEFKKEEIVAITGDTRSRELLKILRKHGIGRMFISTPIRPYPGEKWGFDNGAFKDYLHGKKFDADRFLRCLEKAIRIAEEYHPPYLAVLPDIVKGGLESLELSLLWLEKLKDIPFPWYLAVQDGIPPEEVERVLKSYPQIRGIFLGGTDEFKRTAYFWSSLAKEYGRRFHYARAGSIKKVRDALSSGCNSLDSSLPLWSYEKLMRFLRALREPRLLPLFPL
jgi:hypothetical protein